MVLCGMLYLFTPLFVALFNFTIFNLVTRQIAAHGYHVVDGGRDAI